MPPTNKYGETPEEERELDSIFGTREELEAKEIERQEYFKRMEEEAAAKEEAFQERMRQWPELTEENNPF